MKKIVTGGPTQSYLPAPLPPIEPRRRPCTIPRRRRWCTPFRAVRYGCLPQPSVRRPREHNFDRRKKLRPAFDRACSHRKMIGLGPFRFLSSRLKNARKTRTQTQVHLVPRCRQQNARRQSNGRVRNRYRRDMHSEFRSDLSTSPKRGMNAGCGEAECCTSRGVVFLVA